jgi:hypothetical protein
MLVLVRLAICGQVDAESNVRRHQRQGNYLPIHLFRYGIA